MRHKIQLSSLLGVGIEIGGRAGNKHVKTSSTIQTSDVIGGKISNVHPNMMLLYTSMGKYGGKLQEWHIVTTIPLKFVNNQQNYV